MRIIEGQRIAGLDFGQAQSGFFAIVEITSAFKVSEMLYLVVRPS